VGIAGISVTALILRLPVVLFALTVHEFMHAWAAYKCGDDTAYRAGRLTLNPLVHLDPIGTLCLIFGPIGWAKPVPVDRGNFRYETARRDDILVSGAGIAANLVMGTVLAVLARVLVALGQEPQTQIGANLWTMMANGVFVNFGLGLFNLLPVFPLDGSHILKNLLPLNAGMAYSNLSRYGMIVLLALVLANRFFFPFLLVPIVFLIGVIAGPDATGVLFRYL